MNCSCYRPIRPGAVIAALLGLVIAVGLPAGATVSIDWVLVGDAGNEADARTGKGGVDEEFQIAKYEVTIGQYAEFLNAVAATDTNGLYHGNMASNPNIAGIQQSGSSGSYTYSVIGTANRPITYVSWFDAARFVNWLENGQPTGAQGAGTTETGAYDLTGYTGGQGLDIALSDGATYRLPSDDEWYKAAYYDPSIGAAEDSGNYWKYPTRSDAQPGNAVGNAENQMNYIRDGNYSLTSGDNRLADIGSYTASESPYGTFDQGGNVWEWTDSAVAGSGRIRRGYGWNDSTPNSAAYSNFQAGDPETDQFNTLGFRVVSVPEPATGMVVVTGAAMCMLVRRRSARCPENRTAVAGASGLDTVAASVE